MNIHNLFDTNDMFLEVISYLDFEDKVILGKSINKNCLKKYDFNSIDFRYKNIDDIFYFYNEENDDDNCEYICNLCSSFTSELTNHYNDYYGYDEDDFMNDYYNNINHERYQELSNLFHSSYMKVYARKLVEYIENNNMSIVYFDYTIFELEENLDIDIYDLVIDYYKYVFENEDINTFCEKCGLFGHYNSSKECVFYNVYNEKKLIKENVNKTIIKIVDKIIDNHDEEQRKLKREPLLCFSCKLNNKNNKCFNNCCGKCCGGCKIHK